MIVERIIGTLVVVFVCLFASGALFPPGDIQRQLAIIAIWYAAGLVTMAIWLS